MRRTHVGGNWKMNTNQDDAVALAKGVAQATSAFTDKADVTVCVPFPYLIPVRDALAGSSVRLGAQDAYHQPDGAFTGEVSIAMLKDCGVSVLLTGHSERRHVIGETDDLINLKTRAGLDAGLDVILCIGERIEERKAGETDAVNDRQLRAGLSGVSAEQMARVTIAYEPVWAIGTGLAATPDDAQNAHANCRAVLGSLYGPEIAQSTRIQYGGSMKPGNAPELIAQPDIDGGLIGGASLDASSFGGIVEAAAG